MRSADDGNSKWLNLIINQIHNDPLYYCGKQAVKNMLSGGSSATFRAYDADTQSVSQKNKIICLNASLIKAYFHLLWSRWWQIRIQGFEMV